jgi:hypothetical protein
MPCFLTKNNAASSGEPWEEKNNKLNYLQLPGFLKQKETENRFETALSEQIKS